MSWGAYGDWAGYFNHPNALAISQSGKVYVADTYNHRFQKFSPLPLLPAGPTNLTASSIGSNKVMLSWQYNSLNQLGFKIKRKQGVRGLYSEIATVGANATSYVDTNAANNTSYYYAVWAYR